MSKVYKSWGSKGTYRWLLRAALQDAWYAFRKRMYDKSILTQLTKLTGKPIGFAEIVSASEWVSVANELPKDGQMVMVFRPQVLTEDHTDRPIREAKYISDTGRFDCYHQPTEWMKIPLPGSWDQALNLRQHGKFMVEQQEENS